MKYPLLISLVILCIVSCSPERRDLSTDAEPIKAPAGTPEPTAVTGFIRSPQTAFIDKNGSYVFVSDTLAFGITRIEASHKDTRTKPNAFKGDKWFVYIETPEKIWIFDGVKQLDIVTPVGFYSVASTDAVCPKIVWDALPAESRTFLQAKRAEQGAAANP